MTAPTPKEEKVLYIVTDTKVTPYGDESVMGAINEAEKLRDRTGKRVTVSRLDRADGEPKDICTFLGRNEWQPPKEP